MTSAKLLSQKCWSKIYKILVVTAADDFMDLHIRTNIRFNTNRHDILSGSHTFNSNLVRFGKYVQVLNEFFPWLNAVKDKAESIWALTGTALSQAERWPGQRWVKLSADRDSIESSWALTGTALSQSERWLGQRWVKLSADRDSVESSWVLTGTVLSQSWVLFRTEKPVSCNCI